MDQANRVYTKLENGSKHNSKSKGWFGRIVHERRKDPLLRFIHQARNTEEHGLAGSSNTQAAMSAQGSIHIKCTVVTDDMFAVEYTPANSGSKLAVRFSLNLCSVVDDRFGNTFEPPREHLGQPLVDVSPLGVAEAALGYLGNLITKAKRFMS